MAPTKANALLVLANNANCQTEEHPLPRGLSQHGRRKKLLEWRLVEPFRRAGFDLDLTLSDYVERLSGGNISKDEENIVVLILYIYQAQIDDLHRCGYIRSETRDAVISVRHLTTN